MSEEQQAVSVIDFGSFGIGEAVEFHAVPEGEYQVRITRVEVKLNKNQEPYMMVYLEIPEDPTSKEISKYIAFPVGSMDEKKLNSTRLGLKYFAEAFGIDEGAQLNPNQLQGLTTFALLGVESNDTYGEQNFVKRWVPSR